MLVALDCDGTLDSCGGPITGEMVQAKLNTPVWGILSSRSVVRAKEACEALGITPAFIRVCRVQMRAEELTSLRRDFPNHQRYVYVADREGDRKEALRAGWEFVLASRFAQWEHRSEVPV